MSGSAAGVRGAECRKFAPNIFNKSKCSSCFKQKEEHSAEALECNRATRKISKCGYLFVAPGWDFSNPLNRTKRWQRRWFVLYDDGELTYSVDEHPETVPQARIDMIRILEVAAAEDITGHPYSLALTSPEGVTFVKGTCREETRWWADVLQVYSRNKGRHKRNATFPGGQSAFVQITPSIRSNTPNPPRPRFNSCRVESRGNGTPWMAPTANAPGDFCPAFSSTPSLVTSNAVTSTNAALLNGSAEGGSGSEHRNSPLRCSTPLENGTCVFLSTPSVNGNTYTTACTTALSTLTTTASMVASSSSSSSSLSEKPPIGPTESRTAAAASTGSSIYKDQPASSASPPTRDKLRADDKARRRMNQRAERETDSIGVVPGENGEQLLSTQNDDTCRRILLEHEREREGKLREIAASLTQPRIRRVRSRISEPTRDVVDAALAAHQDKLVRGDPDGCGLDVSAIRYSPTSELRVDLPAEEVLNIKKGWLMKQGANKEWNKHWFVLRGCGLMYYGDTCAEEKGIMDGIIDLNTVTGITPVQVARNYGFQITTWDERGTTVLSAVTAGIRASWMAAIRKAANLPDPDNSNDGLSICQDNQQDDIQSPTISIADRERDSSAVPSTSITPRSVLFSSDEEYRTASEGGRRESGDWSELPVSPPLIRNGDWSLKGSNWSDTASHDWSELPPSPPLTRTALSRVKARSRSSSRSRVYKRSRSSPPSSRRSTLDSVRSEDLMMACCELGEDSERGNDLQNSRISSANDSPLIVELLENRLRDQLDQNQAQPNALLVMIERQENEIESLKSQLNSAHRDVANAEKELSRLRQQKAEASIREKQLEELLNTMHRNEQQRNKDLEDVDKLKKLFNRDKEMLECKLLETEAILRETTDRCEALTKEVATSHRSVEHLQNEISMLRDRLSQGIEENDRLYNRVRELEEKCELNLKERSRSFDSLSDLTNIDLDLDFSVLDKERISEEYNELRRRFEKAIQEIHAMRKELREAQSTQDTLELEIFALKQDAAKVSEANQAQTQLMAARIQDLTNKLAVSEKQVKTLKQKLAKAETRDKRRSLSLKGRESFQISQEVEDKLLDLESKINALERGKYLSTPIVVGATFKESSCNTGKEEKVKSKSLDRSRLRRKSLDSATSSEPMKVLIRLSTLETKVMNAAESLTSDAEKDSSECSELIASYGSEISSEVLLRLKKLETAVSKSKRRLEKCLGSSQAGEKAEQCLREVNNILNACLECKSEANAQKLESVGLAVSRLEDILKEKLSELTKRRQTLARNNQLDDREKAKLIAERVAFECVVLDRIRSAVNGTQDRHAVLSELVETSQLASNLKSKIDGTKSKTYQNTCYIQYLTKVLADKLVLVGGATSSTEVSQEVCAARNESLNFLLQKQKEINEIVRGYKETKIRQLAEALAAETLSLSDHEDHGKQFESPGKKFLDDRRIREAWALAQETVNKELVQAEVSHVIMRCGELYERDIASIADTCLALSPGNVSLESWTDAAQVKLRQELELSIQELSDAYAKYLRLMKKNRSAVNTKHDSKELLTEYADVIAHKALIDARIALLQKKTKPMICPGETFVSSLIRKEDILSSLMENSCEPRSNPVLNAEYSYLYQQFSKECEEKISERGSEEQLKTLGQSLSYLEEDLAALNKSIGDKTGEKVDVEWSESIANPSFSSVCEKCLHLREQVKKLSDCINKSSCRRCSQSEETIEKLKARHKEELEALKRNQEKDLQDIKGELVNQRQSLTTQYEQEAACLRDRAKKLEHRLNAMDSEHSAHVNELRAAYQRSLSTELDTDAETRKRYKEEIKQLRALCEKGLLAMENSHRRIIAEMEEKHRQELESLRTEKDQALSEETQATLAALDAMRKAHENEVQKEIAKFKQEFLKQVQAREDIGVLYKEHEAEMEEIKQEILSLSAKYSSKCVESAALEEKVGSLTKQLAQAQQHIMQLDLRNRQLRARFTRETNNADINEAIQILRNRDNEITEPREEIHRFHQQLKHGDNPRETPGLALKSSPKDARQLATSKASGDEQKPSERPKSSLSTFQKSLSLACSDGHKPASGASGVQTHNRTQPSLQLGQKTRENVRNDLASPLWDSLRPGNGLTHQCQGGATETRLGGSTTGIVRSQESKQSEKQRHSEARTFQIDPRHTFLTSEPPALSVAELMRSSAMRWSSRSCYSLPPTPTPSYHPVYLPLPAAGMVAERKKRFEL